MASTKLNSRTPDWDHSTWLQRFHDSAHDHGFCDSLRRDVYANTIEIVHAAAYKSAAGKTVYLDNEAISKSQAATVFYPDTRVLEKPLSGSVYATEVFTIGADCLETARLLALAGFNPAVLNMADSYIPGGLVEQGIGTQEENIFRRSTAFSSLLQFVDAPARYKVKRNLLFSYPIPEESGGIYSPDLSVFRSSEKTGYYLLEEPFPLHLITVAAIAYPHLVSVDGKLQISESVVGAAQEKIRAILRIGLINSHDALVLSAFGCGAFQNPPEHVARLFREVLAEEEFAHTFRLIVFAIIGDSFGHSRHNPQGNLLPFQLEFN
ncbi:MAG: TIGR02452 family protein [Candidatus Cloacimonetes bacterium]|nr:TIGR02452 family protein [Candidatus Cloacimonadota bacterium]